MSTRVDAALVRLATSAPAGADPSPEVNADASPAGASSGDGSAPASADTPNRSPGTPGDGSSPAGAPNVHDELRAKLEADKNRRLTKRERYTARREREAAEAERKKAEEASREAEAKRAKWANIGKDTPILDVLREAGRDPNEVFELMKAEALKAGTPEARIEALTKLYDGKFADLEKLLKEERDARAEEKKRHESEAKAARFESDFRRAMELTTYEPLLDEYQPKELFRIADALHKNPAYVAEQAEALEVDLTESTGKIYIQDILNVMLAKQAESRAYQEQRRKKKAAPPEETPVAETPPPKAKRLTVNGAEERKAGSTIGNDLASGRGGVVDRTGETRKQRLDRMIKEGKG